MEHEVPGVAEHLLALAALQVNFGRLDMGGVLLKACNITSGLYSLSSPFPEQHASCQIENSRKTLTAFE